MSTLTELETIRAAAVELAQPHHSFEQALNVVMVRLLTVAVTVSTRRAARVGMAGMAVPSGYRVWPCVESNTEGMGTLSSLRLWVCPKAAAVSSGEPFPVGTTLVVERFVYPSSRDKILQSVFVLEKVVSIDGCEAGRPLREGWAFASYEADGRKVARDAAACGICRLPVLQ